jgi:hypothetical protein
MQRASGCTYSTRWLLSRSCGKAAGCGDVLTVHVDVDVPARLVMVMVMVRVRVRVRVMDRWQYLVQEHARSQHPKHQWTQTHLHPPRWRQQQLQRKKKRLKLPRPQR